MKIEEKNVYKFRSILNTFSIDEIFIKKKENNKKKKRKKRGGWFWSRISENKKKSKSRFTEIKICHFWKFHKSRWINKRRKSRVTRIKKIPNLSPRFLCRRTAEETRTTPITDHEKKWWKREKIMYAWQCKGEWGSDEIAMFLTLPWKMC